LIIYLSCSGDGVTRRSPDLAPHPCEQLLTPSCKNAPWPGMFAVDNGAFSHFDLSVFQRMLSKCSPHKSRCRWVAAPDVVGNAKRTLEAFQYWHPRIRRFELPVALVLQNGIEHERIPWERIACVFIGGDNPFKGSQAVRDAVKCARLHGLWVHMGRVNTPERLDLACDVDCDSIDGTGIKMYTARRLRLVQENPNGMFATPGVYEHGNGLVTDTDGGRAVPVDEGAGAAGELGPERDGASEAA
jgi:hypothetical protein